MRSWTQRLYFTAAVAVLASIPAVSTSAYGPVWARPYLNGPAPSGAYITKQDNWVAVFKEVVLATDPNGGLAATYRMVLAPIGTQPRRLLLALEYDSGTQTLEDPQVWEPGIIGYRRVDLTKTSLDFPNLSSDALTSGRFRFITTRAIEPGKRAIVTWKVMDRYAFPGEMIVWPFGNYPAERFEILEKTPGNGDVHITYVTPDGKGGAAMKDGPVELEHLPAMRYVYNWENPWLPSRFQAIPFILAVPGKAAGRTWADVSSAVDRVFTDPGKAGAAEVKSKADSLVSTDMGETARIEALVRFVAGLPYRNVQWGRGAYTPASPAETLRSMSADCKGKALLLMKLLDAVGVRSNLVLCRMDDHYLADFPLPASAAFNHVVLAVKCKGGKALAASLTTGPGKGWVLVDSTDPLAIFGRQPMGLEGACALWVAPSGGAYFHIHTRKPALTRLEVQETVTYQSSGEARFRLSMKGEASLLEAVASSGSSTDGRGDMSQQCERYFRSAAPGLMVTKASWSRRKSPIGTPLELTIDGTIPSALQDLGGNLCTSPAPLAVLGQALGISQGGYVMDGPAIRPHPKTPLRCMLKPDYRGVGEERKGVLSLVFPAGWSVQGMPVPKGFPASGWMSVTASGSNPWSIKIKEPRGEFRGGGMKEYLDALNRLSSLFQQPILLQKSEAPKDAAQAPAGRNGD